MDITLRQLRTFCAVYETGNFTRAAESLNLTQSTVSKLCSELEKGVGFELFERSSRGVLPREGANDLYAYAQEVLGSLRAAQRSLQSLAGLERGEVAIAASPIMMHTLICPVVVAFHAKYPNIVFNLLELSGDEAVEHVLQGKADLGLVALEQEDSRLKSRVVYRDSLYAVVVNSHPLAGRQSVMWADLAPYPHIILRSVYTVQRKVDQILRQKNIEFHLVAQTGTLTTAFSLVRNGMGMTIMPGYIRSLCHEMNLKALSIIDEPETVHELSILRRADHHLPRAAEVFLRDLESSISALQNSLVLK